MSVREEVWCLPPNLVDGAARRVSDGYQSGLMAIALKIVSVRNQIGVVRDRRGEASDNPRIVPMLQDNLKLNVNVPYRAVNAAVYDRKARMTFSVETEQHRVGALVIDGAENYGEESYEVDVVTLDDYADEIPAGRVVIKVDVEGREGGVLRGAQKMLSRPDVMLIAEYHRDVMASTGDSVEDVFSVLVKMGFVPHFLRLPPAVPEATSVDRLLRFGGHSNLVWLRG